MVRVKAAGGPLELPKSDENLAEAVPPERGLVARRNGELTDLSIIPVSEAEGVELLGFNDEVGREVFWHSAAHVLAQAVLELFPDVKITIGPAISTGFFYDFDTGGRPFTPKDLAAVETRANEIIGRDLKVARIELTKSEALSLFGDNPYKVELINELEDGQVVSAYRQGDFTDLCRGPHVARTGLLGRFRVLSSSGAYWRGDETGVSLQRIYGTAFPTQEQLDEHLRRLEQARERDHRKLGRELELFSISEKTGPGLVLWHPNGAALRNVIEEFWRKVHIRRGYSLVYTPHIGRQRLWETSGHLEHFAANMFGPIPAGDEEEPYRARPMNCPFHVQIYNWRKRSYRELPIRLAELGTVYRYERSGVLHGALRVRGFTQDDAHVFCTPEQAQSEIEGVLDLTLFLLRSFGYEEFKIELAVRDALNREKYLGDDEGWAVAEAALEGALAAKGLSYTREEGEAKFYGPGIDIMLVDSLGRKWQGSTIQFDFNLPARFGVKYVNADGQEKSALMLHRAPLGSLERFVAGLTEHTGGNFPLWLAPVQAVIVPVTDDVVPYGKQVLKLLLEAGVRAEIDKRPERMNRKLRDAETRKVVYMLVVGKREAKEGTVSVRRHGEGDRGVVKTEEFVRQLVEETGVDYGPIVMDE